MSFPLTCACCLCCPQVQESIAYSEDDLDFDEEDLQLYLFGLEDSLGEEEEEEDDEDEMLMEDEVEEEEDFVEHSDHDE